MNKQNISIQLYTARHFKPFEPILDFFSETGIKNIELFGLESIDVNHILFFSFGKSHKDIFLDNFTDKPFYEVVSENISKIEDAFCENGHPNEESHKKFTEYLKGYIDV